MKKEKCRLYQSNPTLQQANFWWSSKPTSGGCVKNAKVPLGDKGMSPVNLRKKTTTQICHILLKGMDESLISVISIYIYIDFRNFVLGFPTSDSELFCCLGWSKSEVSLASIKHERSILLAKFLLMEEILHQLIGRFCQYLQGFIHPRWLAMGFQPSIVSLWSWVLRSLWRYYSQIFCLPSWWISCMGCQDMIMTTVCRLEHDASTKQPSPQHTIL